MSKETGILTRAQRLELKLEDAAEEWAEAVLEAADDWDEPRRVRRENQRLVRETTDRLNRVKEEF